MRRLSLLLLAAMLWLRHATAQPLDEPKVHVVAAGQRLESIARRYAVSVDAICTASGISRSAKLRIGQRLLIPAYDDKDGSEAREHAGLDGLEANRPDARAGGAPRTTPTPADGGRPSALEDPRRGAMSSGAAQAIHSVRPGQTLGGIAQRYGVSVAALRAANGLGPRSVLRAGQKLLVPAAGSDGRATKGPRTAEPTPTGDAAPKPLREALIHQVAPGHTLGKLAKRYNVTVEEICAANDIDRRTPLKLGQQLVIPPPGGGDSAAVRRLRAEVEAGARIEEKPSSVRPQPARQSLRQRPRSWRDYAKRPAQPGRVTLIGWTERWSGHATGKRGKVLPQAREEISRVMGAVGKRPRVDARLVKLIVKVSDTFGGRPLRIVSGYRLESYFQDSRHRTSQALDFSIPGVPNEAVRDYLRTLDDVGVGYYPNSSFVHMDTRRLRTYWVDYSGPGEAPRRRARAARVAQLQERAQEYQASEAGGAERPESHAAGSGADVREIDTTPTGTAAPAADAAGTGPPLPAPGAP